MKTGIKQVLKNIDAELNRIQPKTMDELISIVHSVPGCGNYGSHFKIVEYMGYLQGIRVYITGRSKTHELPANKKVYSIFNGVDKYKKAGFLVINE